MLQQFFWWQLRVSRINCFYRVAKNMGIKRSVEEQFSPVVRDYATFNYFSKGSDLEPMLKASQLQGVERVLDIGSGPGHTALLFAPRVNEVVATDPTEAMLKHGRRLAAERGVNNLFFKQASAEALPFSDASFDRVTSRQSLHHYTNVSGALSEIRRVLKPTGLFVLVDTLSPEDDEFDIFLNKIESHRDSSHVRDYRISELRQMFEVVGFNLNDLQHWDIPMSFNEWVKRSRTPSHEISVLRDCMDKASDRVKSRFNISSNQDWSLPIGLVTGSE